MTHCTRAIGLATLLLFGCSNQDAFVKRSLESNPEIVFAALEKHPERFFEVLQKTAAHAKKNEAERRETEAKRALDAEFQNPLKPFVETSRPRVFGASDAPVTIVEYADFQCPFCAEAVATLEEIGKRYAGKVQLVLKHVPLHAQSEIAARYYEAVALESIEKAAALARSMYTEAEAVREGGAGIERLVAMVGAKPELARSRLNDERITGRITQDAEEAARFKISGTPAFLINGVRLVGARRSTEFERIIDRHLAR